jgi:two-component system sensor histidine kinase CpxA
MTRFFWRIFLSAWAIVVITSLVTFWAADWLPTSRQGPDRASLTEQLATLIARDLRAQLAADPSTSPEAIAGNYALDFAPLFQVYLLDPDGNDLLDRPLPDAVARIAGSQRNLPEGSVEPRLHVRDDGLNGYRVVAYDGFFPLGRELMRPGARALLILVSLLVSAAVSFMLARFIVLPVRRLQLAGQKVAAGDLSMRVSPTVGSRTDDIAKLARDFDAMTEQVDALLQSRHRLLRDVSHELRSPLARLQALVSIARQKAGAGDMGEIDRMETELERLDALIGEILGYTRLEAQEAVSCTPTDIVDLVQNIVDDASLEGQAAGKQISLRAPARCVIDIDSGLIERAIENVVRNALRHTADGTTVEVAIADETQQVQICVDDRGPGVPLEAIDKLFEPFYRVEESRGTRSGSGGIGLAIAQRSVRLHGGKITVGNREGGGLRVEMKLPTGRAEVARP